MAQLAEVAGLPHHLDWSLARATSSAGKRSFSKTSKSQIPPEGESHRAPKEQRPSLLSWPCVTMWLSCWNHHRHVPNAAPAGSLGIAGAWPEARESPISVAASALQLGPQHLTRVYAAASARVRRWRQPQVDQSPRSSAAHQILEVSA